MLLTRLILPWLLVLPVGAVTLLQKETFDAATTGWMAGKMIPNPPTITPNEGPLGGGDYALRITGDGGGEGGRIVALNVSDWTGDYLTSGVTSIAMDLRNASLTQDYAIRLAFNGAGGWFVTDAVALAKFTGWNSQVFQVNAGVLVSAGGTDAAATLGNVTEMRILHSPGVDFRGVPISGVLFVDNIQAVPEMSTAWVMIAGAGLWLRRRRK